MAACICELFIQYERNVLYRTLLHAVSRTVIELAVFTTLICLVVIRVLHTQLNVYLRRITHYVNGLDPRTPPLPLDLRRPKRPWCDEIDLIAEGFARLGLSMAHYEAQRNQAISDLAAQRDALDTRVEERTAELQRMTEHLEILSRSDPLTNLANRRHFDEVKRLEARRMQRSGQPMSLLMMDVDFFKRYNDHFGHAQGDRCLVSIARTLSRTFQRAGELAVRMGGEEFAVLLPGYAPDQARDAAERLRAAVEGLNLPHPESPIGKVTVSVGCATQLMPPPWDGDDQTVDTRIEVWMDRLMRQADDALYRAKSAGRNQIACTTATPVSASPGAAHNDPAHGA